MLNKKDIYTPGIACFLTALPCHSVLNFAEQKKKNSVSDILKQHEINESLLILSLNLIKNTQSYVKFSHLFIIKKKQEVTSVSRYYTYRRFKDITRVCGLRKEHF